MQTDDVIWQVIKHSFCSFKSKMETQTFCRNENNLNGVCCRSMCPLANSRYATVREKGGVLYLYMKTIERAHTPAKMWERVKLSKNYRQALEQIDRHLEYWPHLLRNRCKQRATRITQYLIRMRKLRKKVKRELVPVIRSKDQREEKRERKALVAANLDAAIKAELINRLKSDTYEDMYNIAPEVFKQVLEENAEEDELDEGESEDEEEEEGEEEIEYVDEDIDELEDVEDYDLDRFVAGEDPDEEGSEDDDDEEDDDETRGSLLAKHDPPN
eukprot:TRINITY_DN4725_c0_g1_i2.p1 TRINITY_DN4725_c0_g1~~TRINITY_DN4725_c0_g1_i2.p1  ORF type:complete len:272 (-),score=82.64 TRINITY_DN4725_c0_g1_i2:105-920(-)